MFWAVAAIKRSFSFVVSMKNFMLTVRMRHGESDAVHSSAASRMGGEAPGVYQSSTSQSHQTAAARSRKFGKISDLAHFSERSQSAAVRVTDSILVGARVC